MKKCPFCDEEIQDKAVKCRYCNEFLDKSRQPKLKWYFSSSVVVFSVLSVGPLALPLIWFHPRYKQATKIILSVVIIALTIWCYFAMKDLYQNLVGQLKGLGLDLT